MKRTCASLFACVALLLSATVNAQGTKWHPGHYMMLPAGDSLAGHLKNIDQIGNESSITGVQVRLYWADLEPARGVYDFSKINTLLRRVKAQPTRKQLVIRIIDRNFNTWSKTGFVPNYLLNDSEFNGGVVRSKTGFSPRLWEPAVMDRLISLYKHIAWWYRHDPYFEGIATEETTLSLDQPFPAGYSHEKLVAQYGRMIAQVKPALRQSHLFLYTNWIGGAGLMDDLMQDLLRHGGAAGGSNVFPGKKTLGQEVWTGHHGADYRWLLPISSSVEVGELRDFTPWQIHNWAFNDLHLHYMFWVRNTWAGPSSARWHTGVLPFLRTKPRIRTRCPDAIGVCIN